MMIAYIWGHSVDEVTNYTYLYVGCVIHMYVQMKSNINIDVYKFCGTIKFHSLVLNTRRMHSTVNCVTYVTADAPLIHGA